MFQMGEVDLPPERTQTVRRPARPLVHLVAGGVAGAVAKTFTSPLHVVSHRMMIVGQRGESVSMIQVGRAAWTVCKHGTGRW